MPAAFSISARTCTEAGLEPVSARLAAEFRRVPIPTVERWVEDARARAEHLGITPTPEVVERVAREHLLALVNSAPRPRIPR